MLVFNQVKSGFESECEEFVAPVLDAMRQWLMLGRISNFHDRGQPPSEGAR